MAVLEPGEWALYRLSAVKLVLTSALSFMRNLLKRLLNMVPLDGSTLLEVWFKILYFENL